MFVVFVVFDQLERYILADIALRVFVFSVGFYICTLYL